MVHHILHTLCRQHISDNLLHRFLNTTHSTALIIEDDTDFSLSIRQSQIPLLAAAIRTLFNTTSPFTPAEYFGPQAAWDILYPGHCDDLPSPLYASHLALLYADPTAPQLPALHPATHHFLQYLRVSPRSRLVHRALYPFCTFAYAVTRTSALRVVEEFGHEKKGGISAFDVQLLEACRDGWRCWEVGPELFHHGVGRSEISRADRQTYFRTRGFVGEEAGKGRDVDVDLVQQESGYVRATWNIGCGARSSEFWVGEGDEKGREEVRRAVRGYVQRGECPLWGMGEDGWGGCEEGECGAQS